MGLVWRRWLWRGLDVGMAGTLRLRQIWAGDAPGEWGSYRRRLPCFPPWPTIYQGKSNSSLDQATQDLTLPE